MYLIFGKLLHSNALGKLFGTVAGIACGALMLWILGGDNDISVGTGYGLIFVPAGILLLTAAHSSRRTMDREMSLVLFGCGLCTARHFVNN